MSPSVALLAFFVLFLAFLRLDPGRAPKTSFALWIPLLWMFFAGSRLPAQWLSLRAVMLSGGTLEDGNPIDRTVFMALMALSIVVLVSRSFRWGSFISNNVGLMACLAFTLVSVSWSDFAGVASKRWLRDLGNYLVILVVLSDPRPAEAVSVLLRRLSFVLTFLSMVFIKYLPELGRTYDIYTGGVQYNGITTSKYMLAVNCLVAGLYLFWDSIRRWEDRSKSRVKQILAVNAVMFGANLWVLQKSNGATCKVCLALGCFIIWAVRTKTVQRRPRPLQLAIPVLACLANFMVFGIDMKADIAAALGRNATFSDRTLVWEYLLKMRLNPILGTGYESFWLGSRLDALWAEFAFRPNQAHNGFLEVYLNLGLVGVGFVIAFLLSSYVSICRRFASSPLTAFSFALWPVLMICSITTAAFFKADLLWLTFLLSVLAVPVRARRTVRREQPVDANDSPGLVVAGTPVPQWHRVRHT